MEFLIVSLLIVLPVAVVFLGRSSQRRRAGPDGGAGYVDSGDGCDGGADGGGCDGGGD